MYGPAFLRLDFEATYFTSVVPTPISVNEEIKEEMLRILLVRLIIMVTRLAKKQYLGTT